MRIAVVFRSGRKAEGFETYLTAVMPAPSHGERRSPSIEWLSSARPRPSPPTPSLAARKLRAHPGERAPGRRRPRGSRPTAQLRARGETWV